MDVSLGQDALRQAVLVAGQRQLRCWVMGYVPLTVAEPKEALNGRNCPRSGDRSQARSQKGLAKF